MVAEQFGRKSSIVGNDPNLKNHCTTHFVWLGFKTLMIVLAERKHIMLYYSTAILAASYNVSHTINVSGVLSADVAS